MKHMRLILYFMGLVAITSCSHRTAQVGCAMPIDTSVAVGDVPAHAPAERYSTSTLIIFYDGEVGKLPLLKAVEDYNATIIYEYNTMNGIAIHLPEGTDVHEAKAHFEKVKGVLQVNLDRIMQLHKMN